MIRQGAHGGPVRDIGAKDQGHFGPGMAKAVVDAAVVDERLEAVIEVHVGKAGRGPVKVGGRGQAAAVGRRGGNGAGVHKGHG